MDAEFLSVWLSNFLCYSLGYFLWCLTWYYTEGREKQRQGKRITDAINNSLKVVEQIKSSKGKDDPKLPPVKTKCFWVLDPNGDPVVSSRKFYRIYNPEGEWLTTLEAPDAAAAIYRYARNRGTYPSPLIDAGYKVVEYIPTSPPPPPFVGFLPRY